jgi:excisionase family DNA binding protein
MNISTQLSATMGDMPDEDALLTVDQVAKQLQLHPETVRRWIREGRIKAVKIGGSDRGGFRIRESELARLTETPS